MATSTSRICCRACSPTAPAGFSSGYGAGAATGRDVEASTSLSFRQAVDGDTVTLRREDGSTVTTRVPAGVRDGQKIRLRGKGSPGPGGNGDLILTVTVEPHPLFGRDGDNLTLTLPVTFPEAALGAQVEVPTFDGSTVTLKLPPGTPSGRVLRVKGRGVRRKDGTSGDLLVNVAVAVPQKLDGAAKDAVEAYAAATAADNPRTGLFAQARQG